MFVYILYSDSLSRYYAGITDNLDDRLRRHNSGYSKATKAGVPWVLVRVIPMETRGEAMRLERKIKSRGIRRYLDEHGEPQTT
jgi:putative endonuclease